MREASPLHLKKYDSDTQIVLEHCIFYLCLVLVQNAVRPMVTGKISGQKFVRTKKIVSNDMINLSTMLQLFVSIMN